MYCALYRKWRPKTFLDIVGQEYIVETLKNQVKNNKLSHAYLFTGFRGTGKTTCAKILAKAANCLDLKDGNPCNECKNCKGIDNGSIMDVLEIDAASNNGVENIRDLREEANFTPAVGKYRVYIIDEVHMLSIGAFNALLKIMEEPPPYVIFILATTEAHKVPATILSRCQQFNFKKIDKNLISQRLMFVAKSENIDLDQKAAQLIASHVNGGLRDALSILDSCKSLAQDKEINIKIVSQVMSIADLSDVIKISEYILKKDIYEAFILIEKITSEYIDSVKLISELIRVFKYIMIIKISEDNIILEIDKEILDILESLSKDILLDEIYYILDVFSDGYDKIYKSSDKQLELEIAIIKAIYRDRDRDRDINIDTDKNISDLSNNNLNNKIKELELEIKILKDKLYNLEYSRYRQLEKKTEDQAVVDINDMSIYENSVEISNWNEILDILADINPGLFAALRESKGYLNKDSEIVFIETDNQFFLELIRSSSLAKQTLKQAIFKVLNQKYRIGPYKKNKSKTNSNLISDIENIAKENNIKLDIK